MEGENKKKKWKRMLKADAKRRDVIKKRTRIHQRVLFAYLILLKVVHVYICLTTFISIYLFRCTFLSTSCSSKK